VSERQDGGVVRQEEDAVLRIELKSTDLASPPSPAELEAITMAVKQALGVIAPVLLRDPGPERATWRLGGRWWARVPGAFARPWRH
jgi:hypothetical protein